MVAEPGDVGPLGRDSRGGARAVTCARGKFTFLVSLLRLALCSADINLR